ncbi:MAG: hypothetical protein KGZ33_04655 [Alkaliphilus sp.]|nr:hypothetical protein [Alkaliphilus sp.]
MFRSNFLKLFLYVNQFFAAESVLIRITYNVTITISSLSLVDVIAAMGV